MAELGIFMQPRPGGFRPLAVRLLARTGEHYVSGHGLGTCALSLTTEAGIS
jgi:hypothetical protein